MIFSDIKNESDKRIVEVREYIDFIGTNIPKLPNAVPRYLNTAKGMVYVQLYGIIEYTLISTIAKCIDHINRTHIKLNELKPVILSLALDSELEALIQVKSKRWDKRCELFLNLVNNNCVNIRTDLLPTDGKNITHVQLQSIWNIFSIDGSIFHDVTFRGRLQDIVTNRINIAHGNSFPSDIGKNVTIEDLRKRLLDVSGFCTHIMNSFEDYVANNKFKK